MEVFWQRGYENASCDELLAAMGINCGSMYSTFGDKQALFEKAFALYEEQVFAKGRELLDGPGTPLENVKRIVAMWEEWMSPPHSKGCLVTTTLMEFGQQDSAIAQKARKLLAQIRRIYEDKLIEAQQQGELAPEASPKELAAFLINAISGLGMLSRAGTDAETVRGVVRSTLRLLESYQTSPVAEV